MMRTRRVRLRGAAEDLHAETPIGLPQAGAGGSCPREAELEAVGRRVCFPLAAPERVQHPPANLVAQGDPVVLGETIRAPQIPQRQVIQVHGHARFGRPS